MADPESVRSTPLRIAITVCWYLWIGGLVIGGLQAAIFGQRSSALVAFTCLTISLVAAVAWIILGLVRRWVEEGLSRDAFAHAAARLHLLPAEPGAADRAIASDGAPWLGGGVCAHELVGEVDGHPVLVFQYLTMGFARLGIEMIVARYTCVAMGIGSPVPDLPTLRICPRGRVGRALHRRTIAQSDAAFEAWVHVRCRERALEDRAIRAFASTTSIEDWLDREVQISGSMAVCATTDGPAAIEGMVRSLARCVGALPAVLHDAAPGDPLRAG